MTGVAALLLASALPHQHADGSAASHPASNCRLCHIQQGFTVTPAVAPVVHALPALIAARALPAHDAPRAILHVHSAAPRSPPAVS